MIDWIAEYLDSSRATPFVHAGCAHPAEPVTTSSRA
jgi:hypothetical protein